MKRTFAAVSSINAERPELQRSGLFGLFSLCFILDDGPWLTRDLRRKLSGPADEMIDRLQSLTKPEVEELTRAIAEMERQGCLAGSLKVDELCRSLQALGTTANLNQSCETAAP